LKICRNCHPEFPKNYPPLGQVADNVSEGDFIEEKLSMEKGVSFLLNKKTCCLLIRNDVLFLLNLMNS